MDIKQFQKEILEVFSEMDKMPNRREHTKQSALIHLMEEIGEIARQVTSEYHRPEKFDKENLGTELADTLMFIVVLAQFYDVDLSKEMKESISRVKKKIAEISNSR
jgi:NTP pyrophosphatase (non-canonical NTP hydrolase)